MKNNANIFACNLANDLQGVSETFYQKGDPKTGLFYKEDATFLKNTDWESFVFDEPSLEMLCKTIHLKHVLNSVVAYAEQYRGAKIDHQKLIMMQIAVATGRR